MKLWNMGLALWFASFVKGQNNEANELNLTSSSSKKLFTETTYKGTLRKDNTIKIMAGIETIEPCVDYEFVVDDGNDFSADCVDNKIEIKRKRSDVPRGGHLTLTLYATSTSFSAISDSTKIILELPLTKVEKLFKKTSYEGILKEDNSVQMIDEIETMEPCKGYVFSVDKSNDFSVVCDDAKIKITHEKSDVPRGGHLTLTLYATSNSGSTTDFTKIILELPLTNVEKLFKDTIYEGTLKEDNSIDMEDEIEINKPCTDYTFVVDDGNDFSATCKDAKIKINHKIDDVPRGSHLTLTLYATSNSVYATSDFTKIILELPLTNVEKLFKDTIYEGTLKEDNSIDMEDEIETNKPCTDYTFVFDYGNDFSATCKDSKIKITHESPDVPSNGHLTLTLTATLTSGSVTSDFTKIILELPVIEVENLFKESSYEGILRKDHSIYMKDNEIEINKPCAGYDFVVDDGNDFRAVCDASKIKITHENPDVPSHGHLTLTLYATSTSVYETSDFTKIILELPQVEKLFKETSYEGTLKEDNSIDMEDEIEINKPCTDYTFVVDDGNDFSANCENDKIKIEHNISDVPRDGHLTLTLYATSTSVYETSDFTKIILELPQVEKLFTETCYEGTLKEDNSIDMEDEIEINKPCTGYTFVVDDGNDFSATCKDAKIKIKHESPDVPRDGHLTLTLYAKLISDPAISDFTKIILELPVTKVEKLFTESTYEGTLREDNTIQMIDEIKTMEPCKGYEFLVDDGDEFSVVCNDAKIEITHKKTDVPRNGHLTLTLYGKSTSVYANADFTKIILELPVTKVEKLFKESSYEGTLKEDNTIQMIDEIETNKPCADYTFVVDDGNDFSFVCIDTKIEITHNSPDVPRGGHLTLTLYATLTSGSATSDFTKIILELPVTKVEKLFKESSYEGILKEDNSVQMIDEIETYELCSGYQFVVDESNDFSADCVANKIEITHNSPDVPRDGHLTLTLYAKSTSFSAISDSTRIILELPVTKVEKLFKESSYEGTLKEDETVQMINEIETNEQCADYELKVDNGNDFDAVCNVGKIDITYKKEDVPRGGHLTLTLYAKSIYDPAISDFTIIILELPHKKVEKLFKESSYEGTLREDNSIHMEVEIEMNEPCTDYYFVVDDGNDFSAVCINYIIEITHKESDVPRDGHLTLTLNAKLNSVSAISDFTKIILELPPTKIEKVFKQSSYEGTLREDNTIIMIDEIKTIEPCVDYDFVVDDGSDFSADCVSNKIKITYKIIDVLRNGHLTLTLYAKLISDPAISDFTKIILELPVTKVEKLFKESSYEGALRKDNSIQMIDEIKTMEPCAGYYFVVENSNDFSADCNNDKIIITHEKPDVPRDGHLTLTLYAKLISDPAISDFTKIILELPPTKIEKLFKESSYEGTLREDNTVEIINKIETNKPCAGYDFVVDDGNDFSAVCNNAKIIITHKKPDVPRGGHLTLTLYATSTSVYATADFTKIILELPLTKVEKLFIKSSYEGTLREDNSVQMIDEINTFELCKGYEFVVDDGNDFSADCVNNIIEITHKSPDVPRDGHLTLILYAKSNSIYATIDTTLVILELTSEDGFSSCSTDVGLIVAVALLSIILLGVLIANAVFCCQNKSLLFRAQQQFGVDRNL